MTTRTDPEREIARIVAAVLSSEPSLPRETVERAVREQWHAYDDAKVRDFVPVLVMRGVSEQLGQRVRYLAGV